MTWRRDRYADKGEEGRRPHVSQNYKTLILRERESYARSIAQRRERERPTSAAHYRHFVGKSASNCLSPFARKRSLYASRSALPSKRRRLRGEAKGRERSGYKEKH